MRIRDSSKDLWHRRNESVKALPWHEVTNVNDPAAPFPSGAPPALRLVERLKTYRVDPVANHSKSVPGEAVGLLNALSQEDRKSTRLNSSHDQISYAVFCLKKK